MLQVQHEEHSQQISVPEVLAAASLMLGIFRPLAHVDVFCKLPSFTIPTTTHNTISLTAQHSALQ